MTNPHRQVELAPSTETDARQREVQLLVNIAEPDPEDQPVILTDEASILDAVPTSREEIARRFSAYFRADLELDLRQPLWRLVDVIRRLRPEWPDDMGPN